MAIVTVQKPDNISMSGNLKELILQSADAVEVKLSIGATVLLQETYYPGNGNLIHVDFADVVTTQLSFVLPSSDVFMQTGISKDFKVEYTGTTYTFRCIRSGKMNLTQSATAFLTENFLTWQPNTKPVTFYSPEWLTYFAPAACQIRLKAYWEDKTNTVITLASPSAGSCYTFNMQYAVVSGKFSGKRPMYYDVWVESGSTRLSYVQRYVASEQQGEDEQWYLFENSLGGLDSLRAYGALKDEPEYTHNIANFGDQSEEFRIDVRRMQTRNTGNLTPDEARWLQDMFPSPQKYLYSISGLYPIVFTGGDASADTSKLPDSYTFTYRLADTRPYLDIQRRTDLPANLVIPIPTGETFFLPPRLAEFPKPTLSADLLLPVQEPHTEVWGGTTIGAVHDSVLNSLVKELDGLDLSPSGQGGGSDIYLIKTNDLTLPTDFNVYSAARTDKEIDNILVEINDMFLRKDIPDRANKDIEFAENIIMVGGKEFSIYSNKQANSFNEDGFRIWADGDAWLGNVYAKKNLMVQGDLSSPFFVSGFPAGTGWALTWRDVVNAAGVPAKKTHLEVDDMTIRGILRVYEMVISQLLGENGTHLTADMMKIKSIDRANRIIYLDTEAGVLYNPFWTDDVLMVQKFNGMPTPENDYYVTKQYEFSVEETHIGATDSDGNRLDWIKYKNFVGDEADVAIRDTLVRVDNLTNSDRKGIIKQTSVEPGSPYMDIIYAMKTNPNDAVKTRIGKLENLITPYWGRLEKYGIMCDNLYAKGRFMLHTGEDVKTKFEIVEGRLESEMSAIRQEISDKDNVLRNSSFASDTDKWEVVNDVAFFSIARKFIYFNNSFYSDKRQVATVVSSEGRKVLRLKKSKIVQVNDFLRYKPDKQLVQGDGTLVWPAYYVSFQYRVKTAGVLIIGFKDQKLYHTVHIGVSPAFTSMEVSGAWDGTGDFEFSFSGDIEIYSLAMASNSLEDFKTEFLTRITQTEKEILLHAEKIEKVGQRVTTAEGNISVMAGDINIWASRVTKVEGRMTSAEYSIINVLPEQISAVSRRVTINENGLSSLWEAGFLTKTTAEGALAGIFASKNSVTAASIIATVNSAGQGVVRIKADRIELDGKTIISIVEANSITTNKLTVTTGAKIGGFTVSTSRFVNADNNAGLDIIYNEKKFIYINSEGGSSMVSVRNDGGTGISISAYDSGKALSLLGNTDSHCIHSIGPCYFAFRNNEAFVFDLIYTAGKYGRIHFYGVKDNTFATSKKTFSGDLCVHYVDGRALLMIQ